MAVCHVPLLYFRDWNETVKTLISFLVVWYCLFIFTEAVGSPLTDEELIRIRDGFAARREQYLRGYLDEPFYVIDEGIAECSRSLKETLSLPKIPSLTDISIIEPIHSCMKVTLPTSCKKCQNSPKSHLFQELENTLISR